MRHEDTSSESCEGTGADEGVPEEHEQRQHAVVARQQVTDAVREGNAA